MHRRLVAAATAAFLLPVGLAAAPTTGAAAEPTAPDSARRSIGAWSVDAVGDGAWRIAWTSPELLPVVADRPRIVAARDLGTAAAGSELAAAAVADDRRTVEVTVHTGERPRPRDLDVVLSGQVLDEPPTQSGDPLDAGRYEVPERSVLDVDPGTAGPLTVEEDDYALDPVALDGLPNDVEMVGHVVQPAAGEPDDPLVVFVHGSHDPCYDPSTGGSSPGWPCPRNQEPVPSHLGYDYVQRLLASHGYVTVSIAANGVNGQDDVADLGTAARSQLVRTHLEQWAQWAADGRSVDMDNVILVGHSRGGEGVARASLEIPPDAPYRVRGQVLVAPTNVGRQTSPYVPTVTLLPECDGDVFTWEGQLYTDRIRDLSLADDSLKSSVTVMGANHNFFNTEWTPGLSQAPSRDDWGDDPGRCAPGAETRLSAVEQQAVGKAYIGGAVRLFAAGEEQFLPMYDGTAAQVPSTGDAVVLSHALGGGRDVRRPGIDATPVPGGSAATRLCTGRTPFENEGTMCGRYASEPNLTPHWPGVDDVGPTADALQLQWTERGSVGGLDLAQPLDLSGPTALDIRTIVDPGRGDVQLAVRVTDLTGAADEVPAVTGPTLPALPSRSEFNGARYWAQTLRVDPATLDGVDLTQVSRVELVGLSDDGRVWVLDLASVPSTLPAMRDERAPMIDLGEVEVAEGPSGSRVAQLPFEVVGDLTRDARFQVWRTPAFGEQPTEPVVVDVPAGSDSGTIPVEYSGDDRDGFYRTEIALQAFAITGVMVRDHLGNVTVLDDDPSPRTTFRSPDTVVPEGGTTTWIVRLKEPSRRGMGINLEAVAADGTTAVRADDLDKRWLRSYAFVTPGTNPPLHEVLLSAWLHISSSEPKVVFRVPIRDDDRTEGRETLTFRAVSDTGWRSKPITVVVRD